MVPPKEAMIHTMSMLPAAESLSPECRRNYVQSDVYPHPMVSLHIIPFKFAAYFEEKKSCLVFLLVLSPSLPSHEPSTVRIDEHIYSHSTAQSIQHIYVPYAGACFDRLEPPRSNSLLSAGMFFEGQ